MRHITTIPSVKLYKIFFSFLLLLFLLCARLVQLQIHQAKKLYDRGQKNFLRVKKIPSTRGNILDANNKLIATNIPTHNIYWQGLGARKLSNKDMQILESIEKIINKNIVKNNTLLAKIKSAEKYKKKTVIASDITFGQLSKIEEMFCDTNSIIVETSFKRLYPYQAFASHLLGYLGRMELGHMGHTGKMGLEKIFEDTLKGKSGSIITTINSFGTKLSEQTIENALSGGDIQINLDIDLQQVVETIFPKESNGTCILMDPYDGAILALVSKPSFDPNIFLSPISQEEWNNLKDNHPFLNRAFSASYPPGSIFKLVTISAALETDIITPNSTCECKGYIHFARRKYWCNKHDGHGLLNTSEALEQSCNILFYEIAKKINIDTLADYAHRFGFGEKTNIIFPEKTGIVPTKQWKMETKGERWWKGETLSASIGQSFLTITPIQAARMISSIFTGYLVTPRILKDETIIKQKLDISQDTLNFLRQSMKKVITQGTGKNISKIKDFEVYGKTSTAQTSDLRKRKMGKKYREHRWFVAYLRYKNQKPITFVIVIEHAEHPSEAKQALRKFLIEYRRVVDRRRNIRDT